MRKNENEALELLLYNVRKWYQEEFGEELGRGPLTEFIANTIAERRLSFFKKRLGHLTDEDFLVFKTIWEYYGIRKEGREATKGVETPRSDVGQLSKGDREMAEESRMAEASKTSSSSKGKRIRGK